MRKHWARILCAGLSAALLAGCGGQPGSGGQKIKREAVQSSEMQFTGPLDGDTIAIFDTSLGEVRAVLYPDKAPMAVENFIGLAERGYYDGTVFHRAQYGFVVQGGDATGTGKGGSSIWKGNAYPKELSDQLHHYAGALCAAFSPDEEVSGLSQFYFVQALPGAVDEALLGQMSENGYRQEVIDAYQAAGGLPYLDYTDTVFGQVYAGMEVVDAIASAAVDESGRPVEDVTLNKVTVTTYTAVQP